MPELVNLEREKLTKKRLQIAMKCSDKKLVRQLAREIYKDKFEDQPQFNDNVTP